MKRHWKQILPALLFLLLPAFSAQPALAGVSFDFFYSNLSPHGSWLVSAQYGRVWQPAVYAADWNPYYDGHWVYSDVGWTWVSDYDWGAIPYHYGTWVLDPLRGWVWVPGYVWAPSWVVFRTGPGYVGWAPVLPGFSVGVSLGRAFPAFSSFVFVSSSHFLAPDIHSCVFPERRARTAWGRTREVNRFVVRNDIVVNRGPEVSFIERASGRRVRPVPIERVKRVSPGRHHPTRSEFRVGSHSRRAGEALRATGSRRDERAAAPRRAGSGTIRSSRLERPAAPSAGHAGRSQEVRQRPSGRRSSFSHVSHETDSRRATSVHRSSSHRAATPSHRAEAPTRSRGEHRARGDAHATSRRHEGRRGGKGHETHGAR